jgi:hypothetical protein
MPGGLKRTREGGDCEQGSAVLCVNLWRTERHVYIRACMLSSRSVGRPLQTARCRNSSIRLSISRHLCTVCMCLVATQAACRVVSMI